MNLQKTNMFHDDDNDDNESAFNAAYNILKNIFP